MTEKHNKRSIAYWFLIIATFFMYIMLTGSKNLYVAEKTTMLEFNPTDLSATMMYYFYAYAVMQIILVFIMNKINIKWYLSCTVFASAILTALVSFTNVITEQWIIYIINGALQAGIWGCSIKILGQYLPKKILPKANALMTSGPAAAGIISYGTAALFGDNWRFPFVFLGFVLIVAVVLFFIAITIVHRYPREVEMHHIVHADGSEEDVTDEDKNDFIHLKSKKRKIIFYVISIFLGLVVTAMFFSLNNVADYFLKDFGGFDSTTAKLITIIVPIVIIVGPVLCVSACEKHTNFLKVGGVFFGISLLCAIVLLTLAVLKVEYVFLYFVFYLLFLICTNGGRSILLSIISLRMRDKINTGVYTTIVNAAASISAGVAPHIFTAIVKGSADKFLNWTNAFAVSFGLSIFVVIVIVALLILVKKLNKKDEKTDKIVSDQTL